MMHMGPGGTFGGPRKTDIIPDTASVRFSKVYDSMGGGTSWELEANNRPFHTMGELVEYYGIIDVTKDGVDVIPKTRSLGMKKIIIYKGTATRHIKGII